MRTCLKGREELQKAPQGDLWHASGFPSGCGSEFASQEKPHTLYALGPAFLFILMYSELRVIRVDQAHVL